MTTDNSVGVLPDRSAAWTVIDLTDKAIDDATYQAAHNANKAALNIPGKAPFKSGVVKRTTADT